MLGFLDPEYLLRVFLVFVRISGLFAAAPFFSTPSVPVRVRIFLAVLLSYALAGFATGPLPPNITEAFGFALAVAIEALTGLALGFAAQMIFYAVDFAGDVIGFQMGLSMAQVYDPLSGSTTNPMGRLLQVVVVLIFVLIDGHHMLLRALVASFQVVPLAGAHLEAAGPLFLTWTGRLFATALRLAAPFMATIFLLDVALGVFARMAPQAELFSLGISIKILLGLGITYLFIQALFPLVPGLVDQMVQDLLRLVAAFAGPAPV